MVAANPGETKEAARLRGVAERLAKLDDAGKLGAAFAPPMGLADDIVETAQREEGWALNP